jgi:hypothetical protein
MPALNFVFLAGKLSVHFIQVKYRLTSLGKIERADQE